MHAPTGVLPTTDKVCLLLQPPNSPDTNICDLGLFNALQSAYWKMSPQTSVDILECVAKAWENYPWQKINHLFLTLQMVFNEIIEHHGGNSFETPHLGKFKLERAKELPVSLLVHPTALSYVVAMDDPDFDEMEDDDLPLPGTVSRAELQDLMEDARLNDGESQNENSV